jgi:anthranilate phosphoribosyltransferase
VRAALGVRSNFHFLVPLPNNAGAAICVGGRAADLAGGVEMAAEAIDSGAARGVVDRLVATTAAL